MRVGVLKGNCARAISKVTFCVQLTPNSKLFNKVKTVHAIRKRGKF